MAIVRQVRAGLFNFYVAGNMLLCSTVFAGFSKPRETISGFIGRKAMMGSYVALYAARTIDWCYGEPGHCGETAIAEDTMRIELYPDDVVGTKPLEQAPSEEEEEASRPLAEKCENLWKEGIKPLEQVPGEEA